MARFDRFSGAKRSSSLGNASALLFGALSLWPATSSGISIYERSVDPYLPPSFFVMTFANTLLAVSTALYFANRVLRSCPAGRWATLSALGGVVGIGLALLMRHGEISTAFALGDGSRSLLYDATALFTGGTVLVYLLIEKSYRDRAAGPFVMAVVMGAIGCEIWLVANGLAAPGGSATALQPHWRHAFLVASSLGESAFLLGAALGGAFLVRALAVVEGRDVGAWILSAGPSCWHAYDAMLGAVAVAVPTCILALAIGMAWLYAVAPSILGLGTAGVAVALGVCARLLYLAFSNRANGRHVAGWVILGSGCVLAALTGVLLVGEKVGNGWIE